jgi:hypothetical protein
MSEIKVNKISPKQTCTQLTLGDSGDTIIIPAGATISNSGTAAGFGPTGAVSWNTTKITANPNPAVSGVGYFADTTSAAFTITLPSSPTAGAVIGIADYANTFATNNITVGRNGSKIGGVSADATLSTNGLSVTFVYVDSTQGWIVTDSGNRSDLPAPDYVAATGGCIATCGNYKIHKFTGPGTFTVTSAGNPLGSTTVDYLVVAGGGGGGAQNGGGGGAGGFRTNYPSSCAGTPVITTAYPITVGAGGTAGTAGPSVNRGGNGNPSIFSTITSTGGGGGASSGPDTGAGNTGGSGGGTTYVFPGASGTFPASPYGNPAGNTPPVSPPQGNPGGYGATTWGSNPINWVMGGGGGGAGAAGTNGSPGNVAPGGVGSPNIIYNSPTVGTPGPAPGRYYAGGGGAGVQTGGPSGTGSLGGAGGGGNAASPYGDGVGGGTAQAGTANTGGGGGANGNASPQIGGAGGSGIVLIRYKFQ